MNCEQIIDPKIINFLQTEKILTLATCVNDKPHCAICYYVYSEKLNMLIFKSSNHCGHVQQGLINSKTAVAIHSSSNAIATAKGLQLECDFITGTESQNKEAKKVYYLKFPFALSFPGELWLLELTKIKFTDNSLGFSKKIHWQKQNRYGQF